MIFVAEEKKQKSGFIWVPWGFYQKKKPPLLLEMVSKHQEIGNPSSGVCFIPLPPDYLEGHLRWPTPARSKGLLQQILEGTSLEELIQGTHKSESQKLVVFLPNENDDLWKFPTWQFFFSPSL